MKKIEKNLYYVEVVFKICYLLMAIATFCSSIYDSPIQPFLIRVVLVTGGITLLGRLCFFRKYLKMPVLILLIAFCVSFAISTVANYEHGIVENGKWIIWTGMQFMLLYVCDLEKEHSIYCKEFELFAKVFIGYTAVASLISIGMMVVLYSKMWYTSLGEVLIEGFQWGRLWGIFTDVNYGASYIVIGIILAAYFIMKKKAKYKWIYKIAIGSNSLYLIFSDSRTAYVALVCGLGVVFFMKNWLNKRDEKGFKRIRISLTAMMLAAIIPISGVYLTRFVYQEFVYEKHMGMARSEEVKEEIKTAKEERKTNVESDVSSGRISLWKASIELIAEKPIVGVGYFTLFEYVQEHLPKSYIIYNAHGGQYTSLHNQFLNVAAYQGILGLLIFCAIIVYLLKYIWKTIFSAPEEDSLYLAALCGSICVLVVVMMLTLEGIYTISPGSFILWTYLGYLVHYVKCKKRENA